MKTQMIKMFSLFFYVKGWCFRVAVVALVYFIIYTLYPLWKVKVFVRWTLPLVFGLVGKFLGTLVLTLLYLLEYIVSLVWIQTTRQLHTGKEKLADISESISIFTTIWRLVKNREAVEISKLVGSKTSKMATRTSRRFAVDIKKIAPFLTCLCISGCSLRILFSVTETEFPDTITSILLVVGLIIALGLVIFVFAHQQISNILRHIFNCEIRESLRRHFQSMCRLVRGTREKLCTLRKRLRTGIKKIRREPLNK